MSRRRQFAALAARVARGLGTFAAARRARRRRGDFRAYLLEYHAVVARGADEREGSVSADRLRAHVAWLRRHDFALETVASVAGRLRAAADAGSGLATDVAAITFDDGYADNHDLAFPVLRAAGVPATVYLVSGFLDGEPLWFDRVRRALADRPRAEREATVARLKRVPGTVRRRQVEEIARRASRSAASASPPLRPMSWDEARRLRDAGWELGAHTVEHPILSSLEADEQRVEILGSRDRLVDELGPEAARTFAVPNGSAADYDATTLEILADGGFLASCTTRRGSNRPGDDLLQLRRLGVGAEPTALLEARLAGAFDESIRRWLPFT